MSSYEKFDTSTHSSVRSYVNLIFIYLQHEYQRLKMPYLLISRQTSLHWKRSPMFYKQIIRPLLLCIPMG